MHHAIAKMLAGLALALSTTPVLAQTDAEVRKLPVSFGDLDLSTSKGRAQLNVRIRQAAQTVCGNDTGVQDLPQQQEYLNCYNQALNGAHQALAQLQQDRQLVRR